MHMRPDHHTDNKRRAVNLSIVESVISESKALGINASRAAEEGIRAAIKKTKEEKWLAENAEAIKAQGDYIKQHGMPIEPIWMRDTDA